MESQERVIRIHWSSEMSPSREQNQDAVRIYHDQKRVHESGRGTMLALADGLGGHRGGADASQMAVDQMWLFYQLPSAVFQPRKSLHELFERANQSLFKMGVESEQHRRMGSTLSVLLFDIKLHHFMVTQVGDSPIFQFRDGHVRVLSEEHVEEGSQRLTQRLGQKRPLVPHIMTGNVKCGDRFVMISDGIWTVVEKDAWLSEMAGLPPAAGTVDTLMEKVRAHGKDNGSIIVVDIEEPSDAA